MALKSHGIFKEKLSGGLKNDIKNLANFHGNSRKSEYFHFERFLLLTAYNVSAKNVQANYLS